MDCREHLPGIVFPELADKGPGPAARAVFTVSPGGTQNPPGTGRARLMRSASPFALCPDSMASWSLSDRRGMTRG